VLLTGAPCWRTDLQLTHRNIHSSLTACLFLVPYQIMPEGTYLELLSFTHPESHYPPSSPSDEARRCHPLSIKVCGWAAHGFLSVPLSPSPPSPPPLPPPLSTLLNERLCDLVVACGTMPNSRLVANQTSRYRMAAMSSSRCRQGGRVIKEGHTSAW
jgi:hypothetical protein